MSRLLDLEPILTIRTLQLRKIGWSRLFVFRSASDSNFWPHVLTTQVDFAAHRGRSFTSSTVPLAGLPHQCCSPVFSLGFCPRQPDDLIGDTYTGEVKKLLDLEPTPFDAQLSPLQNYFPRKMGSDLSLSIFGTTGFAGYRVVAWISIIEFLAAHSSQHCKRISPRGTLAQWFLLL